MMGGVAIVGIDVGTQSLKAVVTDDGLGVLAAASRGYPLAHPRPGWAEQDPAVWEAALARRSARRSRSPASRPATCARSV
jgi:xylulokinase